MAQRGDKYGSLCMQVVLHVNHPMTNMTYMENYLNQWSVMGRGGTASYKL